MRNDQQEPLRNLALIIASLHSTGSTGRLALRNTARPGLLHLYFADGQLTHIAGSRASVDDAIVDLAGWTQGQIRFDKDVRPEHPTLKPEQADFFQRTILFLQQRGVVSAAPTLTSRFPAQSHLPNQPLNSTFTPPRTPVRQGSEPLQAAPSLPPVLAGEAEVLLTRRQWQVLVNVTRSMLEQVGQLFGERQAQNIFQHVLAEQSEQSEVLSLLQLDRRGWLREVNQGEVLTQPIQAVASAFVLLISDFERRCAALLGEDKARQVISQILYPHQQALAEIGIMLNA